MGVRGTFCEGRDLEGFRCLGQEMASLPESQLSFRLSTDISVLNKTFREVRTLGLVGTSLKV